tara:strand:+ start:2223 stop:2927 length:705 start_codon:yes stop_codon:yes gene_type:complete
MNQKTETKENHDHTELSIKLITHLSTITLGSFLGLSTLYCMTQAVKEGDLLFHLFITPFLMFASGYLMAIFIKEKHYIMFPITVVFALVVITSVSIHYPMGWMLGTLCVVTGAIYKTLKINSKNTPALEFILIIISVQFAVFFATEFGRLDVMANEKTTQVTPFQLGSHEGIIIHSRRKETYFINTDGEYLLLEEVRDAELSEIDKELTIVIETTTQEFNKRKEEVRRKFRITR